MDCIEERVDLRIPDPEGLEEGRRLAQLQFRLNHTMPMTQEYLDVMKELFDGRIGENSMVMAPVASACINKVKIGSNVFVNSNSLFMARGGITIEDDVQIAANCQLLSNNHDPYDRQVLLCRPIRICRGAWIGAGVTVLPGVCIGKYAIVGAGSVVTKDIPDYAVAVGSPARVVKYLDRERFSDEYE